MRKGLWFLVSDKGTWSGRGAVSVSAKDRCVPSTTAQDGCWSSWISLLPSLPPFDAIQPRGHPECRPFPCSHYLTSLKAIPKLRLYAARPTSLM